jgi:hypothetical protein
VKTLVRQMKPLDQTRRAETEVLKPNKTQQIRTMHRRYI